MKISASEPGVILSAAVHAALLLATLVSFSDTKTFDLAQESVPVEVITDKQLNEIMKGDKKAPAVQPRPKVEKEAEVAEQKPQPPTQDAKRDIPTPPPPLKRIPDPGEDEKPEAPTPPQRVAALPPPPPLRPEPPKPAPAEPVKTTPPPRPTKAEEKEEDEKEDAEPIDKKPPPKPKVEPKKVEEKPAPPEPPKKVRPVEKPAEPPKPKEVAKPKEEPSKLKTDQVAKLLEQKKLEELAKADSKADAKPSTKPGSKPKSGDETSDPKTKFNPSDISKLLSKEAPQRAASTGRERSQTASLGSPTANAPRMSPSLMGQLDGHLQDQYKQCWSYFGTGATQNYIPKVRVHYKPDGSLADAPVLLNPPSDPNLRSLADSALRAVRKCNPLDIPERFKPYYDHWKGWEVKFNPAEMS